jgi:hypothetical protein
MIKKILLGFICFGVVSCEPEMSVDRYIENRSNDSLIIEFKAIHNQKDTSFQIMHNSKSLVFNQFKRERSKYFDCCACDIEFLDAKSIDDSKHLIKDFKLEKNWILVKDKKNKHVSCFFVINEKDID